MLDGSRCVNCQHCLQFCLFGVYTLDAQGNVAVSRPDQCKPGCPACSRVCPQGAIMFPLYERDAAIAGARMLCDSGRRRAQGVLSANAGALSGMREERRLEALHRDDGTRPDVQRVRSPPARATAGDGRFPNGRPSAIRRSGRSGRWAGPGECSRGAEWPCATDSPLS